MTRLLIDARSAERFHRPGLTQVNAAKIRFANSSIAPVSRSGTGNAGGDTGAGGDSGTSGGDGGGVGGDGGIDGAGTAPPGDGGGTPPP